MMKKLLLLVTLISLAQMPSDSAARSRHSAHASHRHASAAPLESLKGRLLVKRDYVKDKKRFSFLYSMKPDGSDRRHLLPEKGKTPNVLYSGLYYASGQFISPDGRFIAVSSNYGHLNSFSASTATQEICLYTIKTGVVKQLTDCGYGTDCYGANFSPDSRKIVFLSGQSSSADDRDFQVAMINIDGSGKKLFARDDKRLESAGSARFIGDGLKIYYSTYPASSYREDWSHNYIMNADGSQKMQLPDDESSHFFSLDGKKVAFARKVENGTEIFVRNVDGSQERKVVRPDKPMSLIKASNDLQLFSFERYVEQSSAQDRRAETYTIFTYLALADGTVRPLVNASQAEHDYAKIAFSPNSQQVAYPSKQGEHWQIFTMNDDGSNKKQLTKNEADDAIIGWL